MAPLDTGSVTHVMRLADPFGRGPGPSPASFATLGDFLQAARDHKGLSLAQVADATRVRRIYLEAIERGDLTPLPSRPFAVGYVRSYARCLGLDGDGAVARFKAEHPEAAAQLRAPVGVPSHTDPRRRVLYAALGVVAAAVGLWNVAQRTLTTDPSNSPQFPTGAPAWPQPYPKGPLHLGAATAPPADQTTPKPYVTPGLGVPGIDPDAADDAADKPPSQGPAPGGTAVTPPAPSPASFTTRATVYGLPAGKGPIIIQAKAPASLIVRGPQGAIYFARQLETGEAYRAPLGRGLTADVSDPQAFDVYLNGRLSGGLSEPQSPLDEVAQKAAQTTAQTAAVSSPADATHSAPAGESARK